MLFAAASYLWVSVEKPRKGLPRLPFCTFTVVPVLVLRPKGSAMVFVVLTFRPVWALSRDWFLGLMFSAAMNRCVPLLPIYAISMPVFLATSHASARFQFCEYGVWTFCEMAKPGPW